MTYQAMLGTVPDDAAWRGASYILTWYHPPLDNDAAVMNQVAIWRLLGGMQNCWEAYWLPAELENAGIALADTAYGKDVVREGDVLQWVEPITSNQSSVVAEPGEIITFKAMLTDAAGTPRPNVRILFSATLTPGGIELDLAHLYPSETHTDNDGIAEVTVQVPSDIQHGSRIEVKASTKSVWPQLYLDIDDQRQQDLV
jgi:hypothetical protein